MPTLTTPGKVSIDRLNDFVKHSELLDSYTNSSAASAESAIIEAEQRGLHPPDSIGFNNATFSWSAEEEDLALDTPSRQFRLFVEGELVFKSPGINLIVGPTCVFRCPFP